MAVEGWGFKRIGHRLMTGFAVVLFITLLIGAGAGWQLWRIGVHNDSMSRNTQYLSLAQQWSGLVRANLERAMNATRLEAVMQSADGLQDPLNPLLSRMNGEMADTAQRTTQLQERLLMQDDPTLKGLIDAVNQSRERFVQTRGQIRDDLQMGEGADRVDKELTLQAGYMLTALDNLSNYLESSSIDASRELAALVSQAQWAMGALMGLALLVGGAVAWQATRALSQPVAYAAQVAHEIAKGRLDVPIRVSGRDETGQLLGAMVTMRDQLQRLVGSVRDNATDIATTGEALGQANDRLAERTREQAAALQDTASSVTQLDGAAKQNADNAKEARRYVAEASEVAQRSGQVVADAVQKIAVINDSSRQIGDIVNVIDSIAFQTNILALNAAVEAARAGEAGRGFAVVASEVRGLAQRSSEAAKDIRTLIQGSIAGIAEGSALVRESGERMNEVVHAVQRVSDIMRDVGHASVEQSHSVSQISQTVGDLDNATQQNTGMVENNVEVVARLRGQAEAMLGVVASFRLEAGSA